MKFLNGIYDFVDKNIKVIKIITAGVLSLGFIGSVALSVFSGGEFKNEVNVEEAKGMLTIAEAKYSTSYIAGDKFSFDKENAKIQLLAKDPLIQTMVIIDELPESEYGFKVNGEGDVYLNPADIILSKDVDTIDVVSVVYPNIKSTIDVNVLSGINSEKLSNSILFEAETANIYKDDVLLTQEDLETKPALDKPYLSNKGTSPDGLSCSGGACLRNFQTNNMKVEFIIVSNEDTRASLTVGCCKRKESVTFETWYKVDLNGAPINDVGSQTMPVGTGYFEPHTLNSVDIRLSRGINYITFRSGSSAGTSSPGNLDFIKLDTTSNVIGTFEAVVE